MLLLLLRVSFFNHTHNLYNDVALLLSFSPHCALGNINFLLLFFCSHCIGNNYLLDTHRYNVSMRLGMCCILLLLLRSLILLLFFFPLL